MIISLSGKARAGKDSVGYYLEKMYGFQKVAFATPIKESVKLIYGWTNEHVYGSLKEVMDPFWKITPREVMQRFGTECCRNNLREDIWIKVIEKKISENPEQNFVITDTRFKNELEFSRKINGLLVKINRDNLDGISDKAKEHSSEKDLDNYFDWDAEIDNNSDWQSLWDQVDLLMSRYI